jgi:hypothetical protein
MRRVTAEEFLEELRLAASWEIKTNSNQELVLFIYGSNDILQRALLEPGTNTDFYEYQRFCTLLDRAVLYDQKVRGARRVDLPTNNG